VFVVMALRSLDVVVSLFRQGENLNRVGALPIR